MIIGLLNTVSLEFVPDLRPRMFICIWLIHWQTHIKTVTDLVQSIEIDPI